MIMSKPNQIYLLFSNTFRKPILRKTGSTKWLDRVSTYKGIKKFVDLSQIQS